jgi:fluoride ion exporter CrcB/FEX
MGGLTTRSTFDDEITGLLQDGAVATALLHVGATRIPCFVAGLLGIVVAVRRP